MSASASDAAVAAAAAPVAVLGGKAAAAAAAVAVGLPELLELLRTDRVDVEEAIARGRRLADGSVTLRAHARCAGWGRYEAAGGVEGARGH